MDHHSREVLLISLLLISSNCSTPALAGRSFAAFIKLGRSIPDVWRSGGGDDLADASSSSQRNPALVDLRSAAGMADRLQLRGRALLYDFRDISPPGMWPVDDDEDREFKLRRALLSDLRDISPPGIWPVDGDDDWLVRRRTLFSDLPDVSPPGKRPVWDNETN